MLAPNHCRPPDPMVLGVLSHQLAQPFYIVASWHLFMQNAFQTFLLPRLGVFSIYREGSDREAPKCAMQVTAAADRPLVVFPEGVISRHNDKLNNLMEGTALMARGAAKERAKLNPPGKVLVHPVAIRYFFDGDVPAAVEPVLRDIQRRLSWQPQDTLPLAARIEKIGKALLAMKEIEYFGAAQDGPLGERLQKLIDRLLVPLEAEWLEGRREADIVQPVKLLRIAIAPEMASGNLDEAELQRRWRQLADIYLSQQLAFYPVGYWGENPTPERLLETVEKFEEDLIDTARVHAPMCAIVDVGEAIEVSPERTRSADGDPLMVAIREQLEAMLAASLAERSNRLIRPGKSACGSASSPSPSCCGSGRSGSSRRKRRPAIA
jgi:1-acyl-sn-glycerol-3-phosphate acyltransferase